MTTSPAFTPPRILCVGHAVIDFIMRVDVMPDRAEKYRASEAQIAPGGCATNAAVAAARLGASVRLCSRAGDDIIAEMISTELGREGVDCSALRRFAGCHSCFSNILVDAKGERRIVSYRDPGLPEEANWLREEFERGADAVLTDSRWPQGATAAMAAAKRLGVPGVIDAEAPLQECRDALELASHAVFSAQGLRDFTGEEDLAAGLRMVTTSLPGDVAVTNGEEGVFWMHGEQLECLPPPRVDVVTTLGAGDVWHGAFALALVDKALNAAGDLRRAFTIANTAAATHCAGPGSATRAHVAAKLME